MSYLSFVAVVLRKEDEKRLFAEAVKAKANLDLLHDWFDCTEFRTKKHGTWVEYMCYEFNRWDESDPETAFLLNFVRSCEFYQYGYEGEADDDCALESKLPEGMKSFLYTYQVTKLGETSSDYLDLEEDKEAA